MTLSLNNFIFSLALLISSITFLSLTNICSSLFALKAVWRTGLDSVEFILLPLKYFSIDDLKSISFKKLLNKLIVS